MSDGPYFIEPMGYGSAEWLLRGPSDQILVYRTLHEAQAVRDRANARHMQALTELNLIPKRGNEPQELRA